MEVHHAHLSIHTPLDLVRGWTRRWKKSEDLMAASADAGLSHGSASQEPPLHGAGPGHCGDLRPITDCREPLSYFGTRIHDRPRPPGRWGRHLRLVCVGLCHLREGYTCADRCTEETRSTRALPVHTESDVCRGSHSDSGLGRLVRNPKVDSLCCRGGNVFPPGHPAVPRTSPQSRVRRSVRSLLRTGVSMGATPSARSSRLTRTETKQRVPIEPGWDQPSCYSPSSRSAILTPSTEASAWITPRVGFRCPRSIPPT